MNGEPPLIRIAYHDEDEGFQLIDSLPISKFGCVPCVGDVLPDMLLDERFRVRRRVFIPSPGEADVWWILVDPMPDDAELAGLDKFDEEMRAEFKELEEEHRKEEVRISQERFKDLLSKKKRRPS